MAFKVKIMVAITHRESVNGKEKRSMDRVLEDSFRDLGVKRDR